MIYKKWIIIMKPITPISGSDVFVVNDKNQVLLILRADNNHWSLPGGCQELGETPANCAIRECKEETGFEVEITDLLGTWSSMSYEFINYPHKDNEYCHLMFKADIIGGERTLSSESLDVAWFSEDNLPEISDGHDIRIKFGFDWINNKITKPYFE
jgi:ADP-ribose pyrophosphatase YjhB (NUDIX family)